MISLEPPKGIWKESEEIIKRSKCSTRPTLKVYITKCLIYNKLWSPNLWSLEFCKKKFWLPKKLKVRDSCVHIHKGQEKVSRCYLIIFVLMYGQTRIEAEIGDKIVKLTEPIVRKSSFQRGKSSYEALRCRLYGKVVV